MPTDVRLLFTRLGLLLRDSAPTKNEVTTLATALETLGGHEPFRLFLCRLWKLYWPDDDFIPEVVCGPGSTKSTKQDDRTSQNRT